MASAHEFKALLQSHLYGGEDRFFAVGMQVAAHKAKLGQGRLARGLRKLIDKAKAHRSAVQTRRPTPIGQPRGELASLLEVSYPQVCLGRMIMDAPVQGRLRRIIREQSHQAKIREHGLRPKRKLLLVRLDAEKRGRAL